MNDMERSTAPTVAIVALTRQGVSLALQIQPHLAGSVCFVPLRHRFALAMGARGFGRLASVFAELWGECRAFVCIMATGIVVRQIAPLLRHKTQDPAVVVLDERGRFVVSLVSGHLGGANRLAREVAAITGGQAVISTASDVSGRPAIDLMAQEADLVVDNPAMVARITRAFLEEEDIWIYDPDRRLADRLAEARRVRWLSAEEVAGACCMAGRDAAGRDATRPYRCRDGARRYRWPDVPSGCCPADGVGIWVSERLAPVGCKCLELRPRNLVVGMGCNRGTAAEEILTLVREVFAEAGLALNSIRNLASIDIKAEEPGLIEAARRLERPLQFYDRQQLAAVTVPNPSATVANHIGVASVCEAAALLSAADQAQALIIVPKQKTANVTVAVVRAG